MTSTIVRLNVNEVSVYVLEAILPKLGFTVAHTTDYVLSKEIISVMLYDCIKNTIDGYIDKSLPSYKPLGLTSIIYRTANELNVDKVSLENMMHNSPLVNELLTTVQDTVNDGGFNCWTISRNMDVYVLRNYGDFRILDWTDRFIHNGKYCG